MVDFLKDQRLETEMNQYWTERSKSYSEQNRAQIENEKHYEWENMILKYAPQKECLNILDVGTGPGFFAIILAQKGHRVTAVDLTRDMLEQAKENANRYKVKIEFELLKNQFLPFPDNTFDLVVSRDVTWMLQDAEEVLKEWYRVTKKGGKVLYFDANWYYYLFNEDEKKKHLENQKMVQEKGGFIYNKSKIMENLAKVLPLSQTFRPDWDKKILPMLGYHNIVTVSNINSIVYTEKEQIQYASKPEFLVVAEK